MYIVYYGSGYTHSNSGFYGNRWVAETLTDHANGAYTGAPMTEKQVQAMCDDVNAHGGYSGWKTWFEVR